MATEQNISKSGFWLTVLGGLGGMLIFVLILYVAYLPNRPEPVDQQIVEERGRKADEAIAAGKAKIEGYEVVDAEEGTVRIPIKRAMELTVRSYAQSGSEGEGQDENGD